MARRLSVPLDTAPVVDEESPWLGLLAFRESNRRFFFGRDGELDDLFRRVRRETLTVLYAQSGLGKTSLLQAGLFPRLREEGFLPVPIRLDYGDFEAGVRADADPPGRQIVQAIAAAIHSKSLVGATDPLAAQGPWEYLHDVEFDMPNETGGLLVPVLVFDQLEELFTLGASRKDSGRLVARTGELLGDLIENRPPRALERAMKDDPSLVDRFAFAKAQYRVLLSLREDYLPHLHALRTEIASIVLNNVRLTRFDRRHALDVVERPAAARHLVTRQVADAIVRTVAGQDATSDGVGAARAGDESPAASSAPSPGPEDSEDRLEVDPSLLSLFCRQLNGLRLKREEPAISLELVASNKESVLRDFYLDCFRDLSTPPEGGVKAFVEDFLLTSKGYRDRLTVERANEILVQKYHGHAEELDTLVDRRLLHVEERGKTPQIELTHDVLAPIALRERVERVHTEELRQAEERRLAETRRAEEDERRAREKAAIAAAQLLKARRQQRVTMLLLGVAVVAAALATWFFVGARKTTQSLLISQKKADSSATMAMHAESTAVTEREAQTVLTHAAGDALVQANQAKSKSANMLADFCTYTLTVVNRFGDSTNNNSGLQEAYNSLLQLSDTSADRMIERSPDELCPRQLDARVSSISADLLYELNHFDLSIARGRHGIAAVKKLRPYSDSVSRWVATRSLSDLTHAFYFDGDYKDAVLAAQEAIPLARGVNPATDSVSFDRLARLYHFGALAYIRLRQVPPAVQWITNGLAVVDSGTRRRDQNRGGLLYTRSQLWFDMSMADSSQNQPDASLDARRHAVEAARVRLESEQLFENKRWLALMHGWRADLARSLGRFDEAISSYDSSVDNWHGLVVAGRTKADTAWIADGMSAISVELVGRAHSLLGLKRAAEALVAARAAEDTAATLVRTQGSFTNMYALAGVEDSLALIFRLTGQHDRADSALRREYEIDSAIAYLPNATEVQIRKFYGALTRLATQSLSWATADTVGQDSAAAPAILLRAATTALQYREQQVAISRYFLTQAYTHTASRADSQRVAANEQIALGIDLGNLSWQQLLTGHAQAALGSAKEGLRLAGAQTFMLVNQFSALVLSGLPDEAQQFFLANVGRQVETPPIAFPCAVSRDMTELSIRGVALPAQHALVTELVAPYRASCPK